MAFLFSVRTISSLFSLSSLFSSQMILHFKGNIWGLYQARWLAMTSEGAATATICTFTTVFIGGAFCLVAAVLPARRRLPPVAKRDALPVTGVFHRIMSGPAQHIQEKKRLSRRRVSRRIAAIAL
jgi:hypothetical protein